MKKFTLLTMLAIGFFSANAQIKKGDKLLGWDIGASKYEAKYTNPANNNTKQSGLATRLSLGVATRDNQVMGFGLSYGHNSQKQTTNQSKQDSYGADVFLRKYYPVGRGFSIFTEGNVGYDYTRARNISSFNTSVGRSHNAAVSIEPGLAYNLTKRFQLEVTLPDLLRIYYSRSSYKDDFPQNNNNQSTSTGYGISTSLGTTLPLGIGFKLIL